MREQRRLTNPSLLGSPRLPVGALTVAAMAALLVATLWLVRSQDWGRAFTVALVPAVLAGLMMDARAFAGRRRSSLIVPAFLVLGQYLGTWQLLGISVLTFPVMAGPVALVLLLLYYRALPRAERTAFWVRARRFAPQIALFLLAVLLSQVWSGDVTSRVPPFAFVFFVNAAALFLLTCLYCGSLARIRRLLWVLVLGSCLQIPIAVQQYTADLGSLYQSLGYLATGYSFVSGSFGDGELFAEYMAFATLWSLALAWSARNWKRRTLPVALSMAYFVAGFLTRQRSAPAGVVGEAAVFWLLILVGTRSVGGRARGALSIGALAAVVAVAFLALPLGGEREWLVQRFSQLELTGSDAFNRAYLYEAALAMVPNLPLTGLGISHLGEISARVGYQLMSTHSIVLWALLSAGWPGLLSTLLLFSSVAVSAVRSYRRTVGGPSDRLLISSLLLATVAFLVVDQLKVDYVRNAVYAYLIWIILGMIASLDVLTRSTPTSDESGRGQQGCT